MLTVGQSGGRSGTSERDILFFWIGNWVGVENIYKDTLEALEALLLAFVSDNEMTHYCLFLHPLLSMCEVVSLYDQVSLTHRICRVQVMCIFGWNCRAGVLAQEDTVF